METQLVKENKQQGAYKNVGRLTMFSICTALGWVYIAYAFAVYNPTLNYISRAMNWPAHEIPMRQGLGYAIVPGGALIALAVILWRFSDSSRKKLLVAADIFAIIGSLFSIVPAFSIFILGRLLIGISLGINGPIISVFLRETAPPSISGKMGSAVGIEAQLGQLLGFGLAFGLPLPPNGEDQFWRVMYIVPAILAILRTLWLLLVYKDDSPKYYVLKGRDNDAKRVLDKICCTDEDSQTALDNMKEERKNEGHITLEILFVKYRRQLAVGIMLSLLINLTGQQVATAFSTTILTGSSSSDDPEELRSIYVVNLMMGLTRVATALVAGYFLDKLGRKTLLIAGTVCMAISLVVLAVALKFDDLILAGAMLLLLSAGSCIGLGLVNPLYFSETLPAKGNNLMLVVDNIMNLSVGFAFPVLATVPWIGLPGIFYMMGIIAVLGVIAMLKFVEETKGLSMYQIYRVFEKYNKEHAKLKGDKLDDEKQPLLADSEVVAQKD